MTELYSIQNPNIYKTETTQDVGSTTAQKNTSNTIFENNVEGNTDSDITTANSTSTQENRTIRSEKELYSSIEALCKKYGLNFSEVKKFGLLERIAGCPQEKLLKLDNSEIQKILECLKAALAKLSPNGQKIDLETLAELAQDYNIAIHTGWSIEGFQKAQDTKKHESFKQRLERMYPGKSPKEALERYFNDWFNEQTEKKLKGVTDPVERERIKAQEQKRQLQDFGRMLANSPDEEKYLFLDAVKALYNENKLNGFEAVFKNLDSQEARTELADSCSPEYIEDIVGKEDVFEEQISKDDTVGITSIIAENQSVAGRKDFHKNFEAKAKEFFEKNKEIIARINEKLAKGEELTEEEKTIKEKMDNYFAPVTAGELIGTAENLVITEEAKTEILEAINFDAFKKPNYRDILERTTISINSKKVTSPEEIQKILNKITNGNLETVSNDLKTGTISELTEPSPIDLTQTGTECTDISGSLGYAEKTQPIDTGYAKALTEKLYMQTVPETQELTSQNSDTITKTPETFSESLKTGIKGVKEYVSKANVSNKEITLNILNATSGVGAIVKQWALDKFEEMSEPIKRMTFESIKNNHNAIAAARLMSIEALENVKGKNHYVNTHLEKIKEEKEEEFATK